LSKIFLLAGISQKPLMLPVSSAVARSPALPWPSDLPMLQSQPQPRPSRCWLLAPSSIRRPL